MNPNKEKRFYALMLYVYSFPFTVCFLFSFFVNPKACYVVLYSDNCVAYHQDPTPMQSIEYSVNAIQDYNYAGLAVSFSFLVASFVIPFHEFKESVCDKIMGTYFGLLVIAYLPVTVLVGIYARYGYPKVIGCCFELGAPFHYQGVLLKWFVWGSIAWFALIAILLIS